MEFVSPHPVGNLRQLAPFVLLSLMLHIALLLFIRPLTEKSFTQPRPMQVYLPIAPIRTPAMTEQLRAQTNVPVEKIHKTTQLSNITATQVTPLAAQPDTTPAVAAASPPGFDSRLLIESAKSMARNDAIKTEQNIAETEKKKSNTQAGLLAQYLKLPHQEIRRADGTLELITSIGKICFRPAPYFAQGLQQNLYNLTSTCPE
jgi:hypothetical protein